MQAAIAAQAPFDILVNNAGTNRPKPFVDVTIEDYDALFELNVRAAYFVAQAVARRLIEAKQAGSIINMSSQMGHVGGPSRTVYCATKHAMEGFTKAMAIELAPHEHPRQLARADLHRDADDQAVLRERGVPRGRCCDKIKLGRIGQVEDLTGAIVFLASDAVGADDRHARWWSTAAGRRNRFRSNQEEPMRALPSAPCCCLSLPAQATDKDRIVGTWKLVSVVYEDAQTKERRRC